MVVAVASLAAFIQVLGGACTRASNSLVTGRGEGWGYSLFFRCAGKADTDRQGFPGSCLFPLCTCARAAKATICRLVVSIA
ncbi:hypothetical protein XH88_24295 [Bradyrhizobium sp. CCBAU 51627]|nr:hypothetical protein [Bradyrhizobium sp. CCBAU 51627]